MPASTRQLTAVFLTALTAIWFASVGAWHLEPSPRAIGLRYAFAVFPAVPAMGETVPQLLGPQGRSHDVYFGHDRGYRGEGLLREAYFFWTFDPDSAMGRDIRRRWCRHYGPVEALTLKLIDPDGEGRGRGPRQFRWRCREGV